MTIKELDVSVINKITAGELIKAPSSILKELVENSIDSNAKNITIYLENSGKNYIKVIDDGLGMSYSDANICFKKYTTSKIQLYEDIEKIETLGFRGEALASICSVCTCEIITKINCNPIGINLIIENNEIKKLQKVSSKNGTIITITNLFNNIPSKKKYLTNDKIELSKIISCINELVLSYNHLNVILYNNKKKLISYHSNDLLESIINVFGIDISRDMIQLKYNNIENLNNNELKVEGYISAPNKVRSDIKRIIIIVNQRPIKSKILIQSIIDAYNTYIPKNKYPYVVLKLKVPLNSIDINITPQKNNIKFIDEKYIYLLVTSLIKKTLLNMNLIYETKKINYGLIVQEYNEKLKNYDLIKKDELILNRNDENINTLNINVNTKLLRSEKLINNFSINYKNEILEKIFKHLKIIGQILNLYLLLEDEINNRCILIDQHAIHEKIIYCCLKEIKTTISFDLKKPIIIYVSNNENILIESYISSFQKLGFNIINFGYNSYMINKVPLYLINIINDDIIKNLIIDIIESHNINKIELINEEIIKKMSCILAIKSGENCTKEQIEKLLIQAVHIKEPYTCPHGRPTIISINKMELDKMFKRSYKKSKVDISN